MTNALRNCTAYAPDLRVRGRGMPFAGASMQNPETLLPSVAGGISESNATL
jgi:hypothetical protein